MQVITDEEIKAALSEFEDAPNTLDLAGFEFCQAWPVAKQVLEFLANIPKFGWVVRLVIAIGDAYFADNCRN